MDTVSNESAGGDEITERISTDNQTSFNNLHDIVERLQAVASVERVLFEDMFGKKVLPESTAQNSIAPPKVPIE